ncbi:unnamed protein product, partial [Leptidea sinapis]
MSTKTYNALISETSELIGECTQADEAIFEAGPSEKSTFNPILSELRVRGQFMKEIRLLKEKGRDQKGEMSASAATAIQRVWRGFIARRATRKRKQKEQLLIGMELPPYLESKEIKKAEK